MSMLLKATLLTLALASTSVGAADAPAFYQLRSVLNLGGSGTSWDHIDYDATSHLVYLSRRADGLTVVDPATNRVVAQVGNANGSGAVAIVPTLGQGFTANTDGSTSVFKLSDFSAVARVSFGDNFDGVVYDPATNLLAFQQADNSKELLVDPSTLKLVGTIEVEGAQLERPAIDGKGFLYLPLRDKNTVYKVDLKAKTIAAKWDVSAKCTEPSGAEYDAANDRLLLACRGKQITPVLAVVDATSGDIKATYVIGRGADDVVLDAETKQVFVTAGVDAVLTVFRQLDPDKYQLTEAIQTRPGVRVMRLDPKTKVIYSMTADGVYDPSKKNLAAISPFYPNTAIPGSFVMLTYARGAAKQK